MKTRMVGNLTIRQPADTAWRPLAERLRQDLIRLPQVAPAGVDPLSAPSLAS